ncbi:hypothetical protein, partial [Martelella sp. HB161492]|uniref:phage head spike fiber domain-containing protein n=1 Tax=Martelella sp. HB161492 TaxID=2720726 RepID=UPI00158FF184
MGDTAEIISDPSGWFSVNGMDILAAPDAVAGSYPIGYRVLRSGKEIFTGAKTVTITEDPNGVELDGGGRGWPGLLANDNGSLYRLTSLDAADILTAAAKDIYFPAPQVAQEAITPVTRLGAKLYFDASKVPFIAAASEAAFTRLYDDRQLSIEGPESGLAGAETNPRLWTVSSATVTDEATAYGDLVNGLRVASAGQTFHRILRTYTASVAAGTMYCGHVLIKKGTSATTSIRFRNGTTATESKVVLTFSTGLLTSTTDAGAVSNLFAKNLGNDYWWLGSAWTPAEAATVVNFGVGPESATTGEDVVVYAGQLEAGDRPSSIIPNITSSAGVRAEDKCLLTDKAIALFNREQWTMVLDFVPYKTDATVFGRALQLDGANGSSDSIYLYRSASSGNWAIGAAVGNTPQGSAGTGVPYVFASRFRVVIRRTGLVLSVSINGSAVFSFTPAELPTITTGRIGAQLGGSNSINLLRNEFSVYDGAATD